MYRILAVEDSPEAFRLIHNALGTQYKIEWAKSLKDASDFLSRSKFDLILLDGNLPDGDGFQFCSMINASDELSLIPKFFLTARTNLADKVMGFSVGADDFITKPFEPMELRARIESKLRKKARTTESANVVTCGDLEINKSTQRATMNEDGVTTELTLTPIEFKLLLLFMTKPDIVHSRDSILDTVWGNSVHVYARSVDTHVSKLRKKLGRLDSMIVSTHGSGYRMLKPDSQSVLHTESNLSAPLRNDLFTGQSN